MLKNLLLLHLLVLSLVSGQEFDPVWKFTFQKPEDGWTQSQFDDSSWQSGKGGSGEPSTPGSRVATFWKSSDIWLRRTITLAEIPQSPTLYLHHDEDAEVFLNGTRIASFNGFNGRYQSFPIKPEFHSLFKKGPNLLAVHCAQTTGGQFIDVHLIDGKTIPKLPRPAPPVPPLVKNEMITPWGEKVTPGNAWQEYPRPQLVRDNWTNLNGEWNYAVTGKDDPKPDSWEGKILVPFAIESKLSGVQKQITPRDALWYQRTFTWKKSEKRHTLLNFEAVDYQATVWVNGREMGTHTGGNLPFSFDITSALKPGENTLTVKVLDATDSAYQLHGKPLFHWGTLDQEWWPDGLLTPPSDAAMVSDTQFLREAGFNTIRKHIKVEPRRYYHHCDRLGMLVWQDQVSAKRRDDPPWPRLAPNPPEAAWPDKPHEQFMTELKEMVDTLHNHPSIVQWVPFNERWGQHRTISVGNWLTTYDPTRQVNIASGGNFFPVGHLVDHHEYPHPAFPFHFGEEGRFDNFIKVVGEFGGHGFPVEDHLWNPEARNWGYGGLPRNKAEWIERYRESIKRLAALKEKGIAAGIYTQTTDVEGEINGLITYDRRVQKLKAETLREIHREAGIIEDHPETESKN